MPRYLNDLDVFYDPSQQHAFSPGFDEGTTGAVPQRLLANSNATTGSHSTAAIDGYTQGVELTQLKRHDAGFAKIWSGEAGHQLLVAQYGFDGPSIDSSFADDETAYFTDPTAIVRNSPRFPVLLFPIQAAPESAAAKAVLRYKASRVRLPNGSSVLYRTSQDVAAVTMNGAIEPLAIRMQPSFYSNDVPVDPHQTLGSVGPGNVDAARSSDQVLSIDYWDVLKHQPPFVDAANSINQQQFHGPLTSSVAALSSPVTTPVTTRAKLGSFADARYVRNMLPDTSEAADMASALSPMTGSTDNYVRFDQRSAACGWSFDNNTAIGTDSLAFGGMTH